jgi:hypothetical protein
MKRKDTMNFHAPIDQSTANSRHPAGEEPKARRAVRPPKLSFQTKGRGGTHSWWGGVKPTGNHTEDCRIGRELGREWLATSHTHGGLASLAWIVADMPREIYGLEVGFLREVATHASAAFRVLQVMEGTTPDQLIFAAFEAWAAQYAAITEASAKQPADGTAGKEYEERVIGAMMDRLRELEVECCKHDPVTARALAAQIMCFTNFGEFDIEATKWFDMPAKLEAIAAVGRPSGLERH